MTENTVPGRPLYFELKYQDCPHTAQIPFAHGADCKVHCFICEKQTNNFFLKHPDGRFTIQFAPGCSPDTVLERLPDATVLCSVILFPADGSPEASFDIAAYPSERRLRFSNKEPRLEFFMDKGW